MESATMVSIPPTVHNAQSTATPTETVDEARWRAVCARDEVRSFVYAVVTTGVFCWPSCKSRRPLQRNVRFFSGPTAAEHAGFRPCLRCRPASNLVSSDASMQAVMDACRWMEQNPDQPMSYVVLAQRAGMGPSHFHRTFKRVIGVTPKRFADGLRMRTFKAGLKHGGRVTDQLYASGFGSPSRLYESADATLGMPPTAYRNGGAGVEIRYAQFDTALGRMLLAATDRGICFLHFGDSTQSLEAALRREFPKAAILPTKTEAHPHYLAWIEAIQAYVQGNATTTPLPLDLRATVFQMRVWDYLQTIPVGESRSYAQAAKDLGIPTATRAVASACARNQVALLVPCHRVLRGDGTLGGYRWGLERKAELLRKEAAATRGSQTPGSPSIP